jgi:hypothetical protein
MQEPGARGLAEECEAGHTWKKFIQLERPLIGADSGISGATGSESFEHILRNA